MGSCRKLVEIDRGCTTFREEGVDREVRWRGVIVYWEEVNVFGKRFLGALLPPRKVLNWKS